MAMRFKLITAALAFVLGLMAAAPGGAALPAGQASGLRTMEINVGHSRLVRLDADAKRVSVGKPDVADVLMITPRQLYINAKGAGTTNITLWDEQDRVLALLEVRASRDLSRLKEHLHQILPGEPVEVREMEGSVVLSGRVSSPMAKTKAEALAKALAPKAVTSVLEVGGVNQVLLKVRFAEVSKKALKRMNINLGFADTAGNLLFTFLNGLSLPVPPQTPGPLFDLSLSSKITGAGALNIGSGKLFGFLDALKENGLAKILAEPNLVASSGQKAEFLAGGEYPYPVPQKDFITIKFKKFGVQLKFKPEVLSDGRIRLEVAPEVSELDFTIALVVTQGFTVPGLKTRRAKTQLELNSGDSFAMAGLFRDDVTQSVGRVPFLGDIPILGALFRSTDFQSNKTELVIVVTPEIIKPGQVVAARMPPLKVTEPSDFDKFFMGKMISLSHEDKGVPKSIKEMEGSFGHAPPF